MTKVTGHLREIRAAADARFGQIGLRRSHRWELYTKQVKEGVSAWLGLNQAHEPSGSSAIVLAVNPVIGVRHDDVEVLMGQLLGRPEAFPSATHAVPLGYLMPEARFRTWPIATVEEADRQFADIAEAVQRWGYPMVLANAELETIARTLAATRHGIPVYNLYRLISAYLLLGRRERAARALSDFPSDRLRGGSLRQHQRFADAVQKELSPR